MLNMVNLDLLPPPPYYTALLYCPCSHTAPLALSPPYTQGIIFTIFSMFTSYLSIFRSYSRVAEEIQHWRT